ncbi:MAG TPA: class I SAM-dependent methyltransferase [bacterium]|nr:class I SAM-dependent methyltransferase [bacterium]
MLFYLIAVILILSLATGCLSAAPWVPTLRRDWQTIEELANLQPGEKFYEIGCGHGRLLAYLAKKNPTSEFVGLEISPLLALSAAWHCRQLSNVKIRLANFWYYPLAQADVIYLFLMPKIYPRLAKLLVQQLKPESRIIVGDWPFKKPARQTKRLAGSVPYYFYLVTDLKD